MGRSQDAKLAAVQAAAWRKLGAAGRVRVAADLSDNSRRVTAEKIRRSNPSYSEEDVRRALAKQLYGESDPPASGTRSTTSSISIEDALSRLISLLEAAAVPYMLTGSLASTAHGIPRATMDLDVVVDPPGSAAGALLEALAAGGWIAVGGDDAARAAVTSRTHFVAVDRATTWKVDLVIKKDRPFSDAEFERRERMDVVGLRAWVASAEDTIVAKLECSQRASDESRRARQLRDVAGVVASRGVDLDRAYVEGWVGALGLDDEWRQAVGATP